jgi:O-antigen/teichoic acid export membrane protein
MLRRFIKDLATYSPSKLLPVLTAFVSSPVLTRLFLPAEYGTYALAAGFVDFLYALTSSGFGSGVVRFFPAYKAKSAQGVFFATLGMSWGLVISLAFGVSLLAIFLLKGFLPPALYPLLIVSTIVFVLQAGYTLLMNVVRAQDRSGLYTTVELLTNYGGLGLGLMLVLFLGLRVEGLLWGTFLALALAIPCLLFSTTRGVHIGVEHFRFPDALQMWQYAWPLTLGNMAMWGLRLSDRYIIGIFRPASEVGLYSVAYNLSGKSIDLLVALFLLSMGPMVMNIWESRGRAATEETLAMITRLFVVLCLPAAAGLTVLAFPFVSLLTAEAYHEGYRIVGYVAFSGFAWGLAQIAGRGLLISKQTRRFAAYQIAAATVNVGLNVVLVPRFGFVVAGITTLIGYLVLLTLLAFSSKTCLVWRFPWRTARNSVAASICMCFATWEIYSLSGSLLELHLGYLILSLAVAILLYFGLLWALGEASEEERTAVGRIWSRALAQFRPAGSK